MELRCRCRHAASDGHKQQRDAGTAAAPSTYSALDACRARAAATPTCADPAAALVLGDAPCHSSVLRAVASSVRVHKEAATTTGAAWQ